MQKAYYNCIETLHSLVIVDNSHQNILRVYHMEGVLPEGAFVDNTLKDYAGKVNERLHHLFLQPLTLTLERVFHRQMTP